MSGGVRNLRAMFEQNKELSPPDRGRSPGESTGGISSSGTSPRPLSKVRTQFVTVESKNGVLGLRRDNSGDPSMTKRRTSFSIDEEDHPKETAERKQSIAAEMDARKNSTLISETIPEMAIETPSIEEPHRTLNGAGASVPIKEAGKMDNLKVEDKKSADGGRKTNGHTNGTTTKPAATKPVEKNVSKTTTKPSPISTAKANIPSKASPKKSPLPKTPTTPNSRSQSHAKVAEKKVEKKAEKVEKVEKKVERAPAKSSAPQAKPASKPSTTAASGGPAKTRIPASPPRTGFVKPRPRSPTRPVKLPASLTAHTASSGSKTAAAVPPPSRQTLSRASGNAQPHATNSLQAHHAMSRSPSRVSATAKSTSAARKPTTIKSSTSTRPSLGPPPKELKKQPSRASLPAPADESFLARMMRPTTASASKTAEKLPTTPPKRSQSVKRPATRDGSSKPVISLGSPAAKVHKESLPAKVHRESPAEIVSKDVKPVPKSPAKDEEPKAETASSIKIDNIILHQTPAKDVEIVEPAPEVQEATPVEPVIAQIVGGADIELNHVEELIPKTVKEEPIAEEIAAKEDTSAPVVDATEIKEEVPAIIEAPAAKENSTAAVEEQQVVIPEPEPIKEEPVETKSAEPEPIVDQEVTKPETIEDPEDVRAREEIAKLNAEVMKAAAE